MQTREKVLLAAAILIVDLAIFFIPVTAFLAVYVLFAKPLWFRDLVLRLYAPNGPR